MKVEFAKHRLNLRFTRKELPMLLYARSSYFEQSGIEFLKIDSISYICPFDQFINFHTQICLFLLIKKSLYCSRILEKISQRYSASLLKYINKNTGLLIGAILSSPHIDHHEILSITLLIVMFTKYIPFYYFRLSTPDGITKNQGGHVRTVDSCKQSSQGI